MKKYKFLFCALGLLLPGTGLNGFYLKGLIQYLLIFLAYIVLQMEPRSLISNLLFYF